MTLKDYLILVLVSDDNGENAITKQIVDKYSDCAVGFVHLPINGNVCITVNGYYDALNAPMARGREFVVIVHNSMLNADLKSEIEEFKNGPDTSAAKPIMRKRLGSSTSEWCKEVELIEGVVVAKRIDFLNALAQQLGLKERKTRRLVR